MNFLQTVRTSFGSVALNIKTCFLWGVFLKISCTSARISKNIKIQRKFFRTNLLKELVAFIEDEVLDMRQIQVFVTNQLQKTTGRASDDLLKAV